MQKNEDDILEKWILYHSSIVGIENIHLIDNGSNQKSLDILDKYKNKGLNVYYRDDYKKKGDYIYELISINNKIHRHIAIPLDIDEFIGMCNPLEVLEVPEVSEVSEVPYEEKLMILDNCMNMDYNYYKNNYMRSQTCENIISCIDHYLKLIANMSSNDRYNIKTYESCDNTYKSYNTYDIKKLRIFMEKHSWILGYIDTKHICCDGKKIREYLDSFKMNKTKGRYGFSYYLTSVNSELIYKDPISEINTFEIINLCKHNKKFFDSSKITSLDHGNHTGTILNTNNYKSIPTHIPIICKNNTNIGIGIDIEKYENDVETTFSNLFLFHYHFRGVIKLIEKCTNDIKGLKYDINNIEKLRALSKTNIAGNHNIKTYIKFYDEGPYSLINYNSKLRIIFYSPIFK